MVKDAMILESNLAFAWHLENGTPNSIWFIIGEQNRLINGWNSLRHSQHYR